MRSPTEQLFEAALALTAAERVELVETLIASLQPEDVPPLDESRRDDFHRGSAELRSGHVTPVPWDEVKRRAREKAGG